MLKPKRLFDQFNITLPWCGARREERIQFSLFIHFYFPFFRWHFHTERETLTKGEPEWNAHFVKSYAFERRWQRWTLHAVFSHSVTGIVKSPIFKRWIRACINTLLVCFLSHKFVIWCIFHFPVLWFSIKVQVAGAQTCGSRGKHPAPDPRWQPCFYLRPNQIWNFVVKIMLQL